jgi:hypothetical protein
MTSVAPSDEQRMRAALLWAGASAAAAGRSAGSQYHLESVRPAQPEIVLPHDVRGRSSEIMVSHAVPASQMIRLVGGLRTTGVEATLLRLAHLLGRSRSRAKTPVAGSSPRCLHFARTSNASAPAAGPAWPAFAR